MKEKIRIMILAVAFMLSGSVMYAGDDVNISYLELPQKAKSFIEKHFGANPEVFEIEHENTSGIYSVELRNGYDLKFNGMGNLIEIDAPDRKDIDESIVRDVLPTKAVDYLVEQRISDDVEEIKVNRDGGYYVEVDKILNDRKLRFDKNGNLSKRMR